MHFNNFMQNKNSNISIDWVRHAESCSNFDSGYITDENSYNKRPLGYNKYTSNINDKTTDIKLYNPFSIIKSALMYEPNLSFIGMQQAIKLGSYLKNKKYDVILCSPLTRTIMTALLSCRNNDTKIIVVPYISEIHNYASLIGKDCSNMGVTSNILKKRIIFIKKWLIENWITYFDDIEIMEDLIDIKEHLMFNNSIINSQKKLIINKINFILSCKSKKGSLSKTDSHINKNNDCSYKIEQLLNNFIYVFKNEKNIDIFKYVIKYKKIFNNLLKFKSGPPVDFSILIKYEKYSINNHKYNIANSNKYLFYNEILDTVVNIVNKPPNIQLNILCFSHGLFIKDIWKTRNPDTFVYEKKILNTIVINENLKYNEFKKIYLPSPIRSTYENFESLNIDICRLQSVKGVTNYIFTESSYFNNFYNYVIPKNKLNLYYDIKNIEINDDEYNLLIQNDIIDYKNQIYSNLYCQYKK
jgi:hypothetical protein